MGNIFIGIQQCGEAHGCCTFHLLLWRDSHQTLTGCLERGCGRHNLWPRPPPYLRLSLWIQIPEEPSSAAWETPFPAMRT